MTVPYEVTVSTSDTVYQRFSNNMGHDLNLGRKNLKFGLEEPQIWIEWSYLWCSGPSIGPIVLFQGKSEEIHSLELQNEQSFVESSHSLYYDACPLTIQNYLFDKFVIGNLSYNIKRCKNCYGILWYFF